MSNFKITKTILENINEQNDRINECVDIVNGYTTDEETRVNQEIQRQENELRREEQYNNNESRFALVNEQLETKANQVDLDREKSRIDNLVAPNGDSSLSEVIDARVDSYGSVFKSLSANLFDLENSFKTGMKSLVFSDWKVGGLSLGNVNGNTTRLVTQNIHDMMLYGNYYKVIPHNGYKVNISFYTNEDSFVMETGWKTETIEYKNNVVGYSKVRFVVAKTDDSVANLDFKNNLTIKFYQTIATSIETKKAIDDLSNKVDKLYIPTEEKYDEYFAYIKGGFLRCDKTVNGTCLSYNGLDLGADDKKPYKALFQLAFENKPDVDSATATIISTKLGMRKVSDITEKSLHLCFGQNDMHADLFDGGTYTSFHVYTYNTPCIRDGKTLYKIGWEYINNNRIKIYMPDGTAPIIDLPNGKLLNDYCGRYNIFEHFTQSDDGTNKSRALFKKVLIWTLEDTTRPIIYDDFNKADGSIGVTRSGHTYSQFILNNSDYQII